jgi:septal ring factor EnvC (AmiA/AmiB activator)
MAKGSAGRATGKVTANRKTKKAAKGRARRRRVNVTKLEERVELIEQLLRQFQKKLGTTEFDISSINETLSKLEKSIADVAKNVADRWQSSPVPEGQENSGALRSVAGQVSDYGIGRSRAPGSYESPG